MEEELRAIGLTGGEIKVYLTLLKLGEATNSPIARNSGLQSSTVYYCLNSLIEKGFVSYINKRGKHYIPTNPENILSLLDLKAKEIEKQQTKIKKILPELKSQFESIKEKTIVEVYEGFNGLQTIFNNILTTLKKGESYEAFVIEQVLGQQNMNLLFQRHNKALKNKGIKLNLLANQKMKKVFEKIYGKEFMTTYQEFRYTNEIIPVGITIYKDFVITHISEDERPMSFLVKNSKLAKMYKKYFYFIWDKTKK